MIILILVGKPDPARDVVPTLQGLLGVHAVFKVHLSWKTPIYTGHLKMLAYRVVYWNKKMCKNYPSNCASMQEYWLDSSRLSHNFTFPKYRGSTTICFVVQSVNTNGLSKPSDRACTSFIPTPVKIPTRKSHIATTEGTSDLSVATQEVVLMFFYRTSPPHINSSTSNFFNYGT